MKIEILLNALAYQFPGLSSTESPNTVQDQDSSSGVNNQQQQPIGVESAKHGGVVNTVSYDNPISTISWGQNRVDIFALTGNNLTHKFWAGDQWIPSGAEMETLGNGLATPPVATTGGANRLDIFGLDDHEVLKHQYWDGTAWQPNVDEFENLGAGCSSEYSIDATTWGENRLDNFCTSSKGEWLHQYYDGSQWQPAVGKTESLDISATSGPSVVTWGKNRLDIFFVSSGSPTMGAVGHLYWDGTQWVKEKFFSSGWRPLNQTLTVTSWGENRLDIYAVSEDGQLYHMYWDGSQWQAWEALSIEGDPILEAVAAVSWSPNRHDIVARAEDHSYVYKYWDGTAWKPNVQGWYSKGNESFTSFPSVSSWGANQLDIFGVSEAALLHQTWVGTQWYPDVTSWEILGNIEKPQSEWKEDPMLIAEFELRK